MPKPPLAPPQPPADESHEDSTPERILQAALEEFAAFGFAGARVERIAQRARCNKQLLYHHFGNKEELCRRVLSEAMLRHSKEMPEPRVRCPAELVARGLEHATRAKGHDAFRMLHWESLDFDAPLALDERRAHFARLTQSCDFIQDEALRPYAFLGLISMVLFPHLARHFPLLITDEPASSPLFQERYLQALRLLLAACPGDAADDAPAEEPDDAPPHTSPHTSP